MALKAARAHAEGPAGILQTPGAKEVRAHQGRNANCERALFQNERRQAVRGTELDLENGGRRRDVRRLEQRRSRTGFAAHDGIGDLDGREL